MVQKYIHRVFMVHLKIMLLYILLTTSCAVAVVKCAYNIIFTSCELSNNVSCVMWLRTVPVVITSRSCGQLQYRIHQKYQQSLSYFRLYLQSCIPASIKKSVV